LAWELPGRAPGTFQKTGLLALSEKSPARRSDAPKLPYSQYFAMGQEHLARRSKAPLRVRDPTLVRQRIGFHTVTRQDDRVSHDPPLKMLMSRAVLVICLVIQSDPNRAIGPAISNQW
jgi:hypothetical protein